MIIADIKTLPLTRFNVPGKPEQQCDATFPLFGAHGTESSATVYFELDAGHSLGAHTDSAEEILFVVGGEVEARIEGNTVRLNAGQLVVVPRMAVHDVRNVGEERAKILGFFGGANHIVATFENIWSPTGSNVVDTSLLV